MARVVTRPVLLFPVDGGCEFDSLPQGPTLDYLQEKVGGYIDVIRMGPIPGTALDLDLWVNDEGRINGMSPNALLSRIVSNIYEEPCLVFGTGVLTASNREGSTVPLPSNVAAEIWQMVSPPADVPMHTSN